MRLWTIQGIEIYNQMQKNGFAYCTKPNWSDYAEFMRAYRWMSLDKAAGKYIGFNDYPADIQREIEASWEPIFDLNRRDKTVGRTHRRNRSIQATFWVLRQEYVCSVEFLERKGNLVRQIDYEKQML